MFRREFRLSTLVLMIASTLTAISSQLGFYIEASLFNSEIHFGAVTGAISIMYFLLSAPEIIIIVGKNIINENKLAVIMTFLTALVLFTAHHSFNQSRELRENSCFEQTIFSHKFKQINIKQGE